ncbi:MAG: radical SAM protein [Candidatus Aminicenantaceae bacterium]
MKLLFPFDPLQRSKDIESLVMKGKKRLYHRFRPAPYYGGIATADAIGCSFLCAYCWNYFKNLNPARFDKFYSPQQVASNLLDIARRKSFNLFRVTGSEPILGEASLEHLIEVIKAIFHEKRHSIFILETNGFYLGCQVNFIKRLKFENLWIRISLKGVNENSFEQITGAKKEFFRYPLVALKELEDLGLKAWPAVMKNLFTDDDIAQLKRLLAECDIKAGIEEEFLEEYPFVLENMKKRNVWIVKI